ncbi:MAG: hypothetical protein DMD61_11435 [Gemmatimonadetes bacterium]|nr:MAG: hypothetical protein DMD61_11435 [Gemmatimonadota bacterium]
MYAFPSEVHTRSTRSLAYSPEPQTACTVRDGVWTLCAARAWYRNTQARNADSRRTELKVMVATVR